MTKADNDGEILSLWGNIAFPFRRGGLRPSYDLDSGRLLIELTEYYTGIHNGNPFFVDNDWIQVDLINLRIVNGDLRDF